MKPEKYLIVISGATATGKSALAVRVAKHFDTEILSADSRQFYREMEAGTAKPTPEQLAAVPHHFINSLSVHEEYSVGHFVEDALTVLDKIFKKKNVAVLVGGSGLYIRALCEGLDEYPAVPASVRQEVMQLYESQGLTALQEALRLADPEYAGRVDMNNPHRLLRALSVFRASGKPFSFFQTKAKKPRPFHPIYLLLQLERSVLYERINRRVDDMLRLGLPEEAKRLFPLRHLSALQTVGYQELFDYLEGRFSLDTAVDLIRQNTRRYAKRQITWFKKDAHWNVFSPDEVDAVFKWLTSQMNKSS